MERFDADSLLKLSGGNFNDRMAELLSEQFPEEIADPRDQAVRDFIVKASNAARHWGFEADRDIAIFVFTGYLLGERFEQRFPAINACLREEGMSARDKADWLEAFTVSLFDTLTESDRDCG